jgi:hypothetical protein
MQNYSTFPEQGGFLGHLGNPVTFCKAKAGIVCIADPKINVLSRTRDAGRVAKTLVSVSHAEGFDKTIDEISATDFSGDRMRHPSSDKVCSRLTLLQLPNLNTVDDYGHSLRSLWDWLTDAAPKAATCCGEIIDFDDCLLWRMLLLLLVHWHHGVSLLIWIILWLHLRRHHLWRGAGVLVSLLIWVVLWLHLRHHMWWGQLVSLLIWVVLWLHLRHHYMWWHWGLLVSLLIWVVLWLHLHLRY